MGLLLLTILIAPLPLLLVVTGRELFLARKPVVAARHARFYLPDRGRNTHSR